MMPLFASLNLFVAKLNPSCTAFSSIQNQAWQRKTPFGTKTDHLGVNKLGNMMKIISVGAELSQIYSNHSVRASAITLPFPTRIFQTATSCSFQGTVARSLAQCVSRPSVTQLESVSDTISNAEENNQPQGTETFTMVKVALIQSSDRLASNVAMSTATASFPRGLKTYRSF